MAKKEKSQPNMINHYCYYPHYSGDDCSGNGKINIMALLTMLHLSEEMHNMKTRNGKFPKGRKLGTKQMVTYNKITDTLDELVGEVEDTLEYSYALSQAIDGYGFTPSDVLKSLSKKGYFVADWEEGSFYFATDEALEKAQKKLNKLEARHEKDAREF